MPFCAIAKKLGHDGIVDLSVTFIKTSLQKHVQNHQQTSSGKQERYIFQCKNCMLHLSLTNVITDQLLKQQLKTKAIQKSLTLGKKKFWTVGRRQKNRKKSDRRAQHFTVMTLTPQSPRKCQH